MFNTYMDTVISHLDHTSGTELKFCVGIIGCGNVGFSSLLGFETYGVHCIGFDTDVNALKRIENTFGSNNVASSLVEICESVDVLFLCVPTEPAPDGSCDLSIINNLLDEIAAAEKTRNFQVKLVVQRSTCPPGTGRDLSKKIKTNYAVSPSFLSKKTMLEDAIRPPRIAYGGSQEAIYILDAVHKCFPHENIFRSNTIELVELLKYVENTLDAVLISLWNEYIFYSDAIGIPRVDFIKLINAMPDRARFATSVRVPGQAFGLWCLPKDLSALAIDMSLKNTPASVLKGAIETNLDAAKLAGIRQQPTSQLFTIEEGRFILTEVGLKQIMGE